MRRKKTIFSTKGAFKNVLPHLHSEVVLSIQSPAPPKLYHQMQCTSHLIQREILSLGLLAFKMTV